MRKIRSFVRREGRLTPGQQSALDNLWPKYGINIPKNNINNFKKLNLFNLFNLFDIDLKQNPDLNPKFILEIGFGMGQSLIQMAQDNPNNYYLGIEVHRPGVGNILKAIDSEKLNNLKIISHDAVEVLNQMIDQNTFDGVQLFFPDPWPKAKHHKRRIIQPGFVKTIGRVLKPNGFFHMATDWENYAEHMMEVMSESIDFENKFGKNKYCPENLNRFGRPDTKFEKRGLKLGHGIWDLVFIKKDIKKEET